MEAVSTAHRLANFVFSPGSFSLSYLPGHSALVAEHRRLVADQDKFELAALKWAKENAGKPDNKSKEVARKKNKADDKKRAEFDQLMDANAHKQKVGAMDMIVPLLYYTFL